MAVSACSMNSSRRIALPPASKMRTVKSSSPGLAVPPVAVPAMPAPTGPGDGPIRVRYWRGGKEIRSLYPKDSTGVRRRFAANLCAQAETSGAPIVGSPQDAGLGRVIQGALESSNVNVVTELVEMIETQRAYEVSSKSITSVDEMLRYISQNL